MRTETLSEHSEVAPTPTAAIWFPYFITFKDNYIQRFCNWIKIRCLPSCPDWMSQSICCQGSSHMTRWFCCARLCPCLCVRTVRTVALQGGGNKYKHWWLVKFLCKHKTKGYRPNNMFYSAGRADGKTRLGLSQHHIIMSGSLLDGHKASPGQQTNNSTRQKTSFQPHHFSQFWFMTWCCLFPRPKPLWSLDWFSPLSLFVYCWQLPVSLWPSPVRAHKTHLTVHTAVKPRSLHNRPELSILLCF